MTVVFQIIFELRKETKKIDISTSHCQLNDDYAPIEYTKVCMILEVYICTCVLPHIWVSSYISIQFFQWLETSAEYINCSLIHIIWWCISPQMSIDSAKPFKKNLKKKHIQNKSRCKEIRASVAFQWISGIKESTMGNKRVLYMKLVIKITSCKRL